MFTFLNFVLIISVYTFLKYFNLKFFVEHISVFNIRVQYMNRLVSSQTPNLFNIDDELIRDILVSSLRPRRLRNYSKTVYSSHINELFENCI